MGRQLHNVEVLLVTVDTRLRILDAVTQEEVKLFERRESGDVIHLNDRHEILLA